ncbi:MAG: hypothetical protein ACI8VT_001402 [Saprospiraceae bacterium]|jgi:hypothetical protein
MADNTTKTVSFKEDIATVFYPYRKQMIWRFDLTKYEDVKANYGQILSNIKGPNPNMPPAPYEPLSKDFVQTFEDWEAGKFQH